MIISVRKEKLAVHFTIIKGRRKSINNNRHEVCALTNYPFGLINH